MSNNDINQTSKRMYIPESIALRLFGQQDKYIKQLKHAMSVNISYIGGSLTITGPAADVKNTENAIDYLISILTERELNSDDINSVVKFVMNGEISNAQRITQDKIKVSGAVKYVTPKSATQKKYFEEIRDKDMVFAYGPAGTGKTFLAVAMAVHYYLEKKINRIILTRPAVEAGEKLGFLPGDLADKINPYLRPLYDALYSMLDYELVAKLMERNIIEVAPLAFMRGRTLTNSFVILDEAQNTTPAQMKMFLTRLGFGSKAVVTGDTTQIDLPKEHGSGLTNAINILKNVEEIGFIELTEKDVIRHPLVTKIVNAYKNSGEQ